MMGLKNTIEFFMKGWIGPAQRLSDQGDEMSPTAQTEDLGKNVELF